MVRNDLREHSHTGNGDGGNLPLPVEVASGETTVPDSTSSLQSATETLTLSTQGDYDITAQPPTEAGRTGDFVVQGSASGDFVAVDLKEDLDNDEWYVEAQANGNPEVTVEWTVYEL